MSIISTKSGQVFPRTYQHPSSMWIKPERARQFLTALANLPHPGGFEPNSAKPQLSDLGRLPDEINKLALRFPQMLGELASLITGQPTETFPIRSSFLEPFTVAVLGLSIHVRSVWKAAQSPREAEWVLFELRQLHKRLSVEALHLPKLSEEDPGFAQQIEQSIFWGWLPDQPPTFSAFEQVMYHFHRTLQQARICKNEDCKTPYFFAFKQREYCTAACRHHAQGAYKRLWWKTEGKKRRVQKRRLKKKSEGSKP